MLLNLPFLIPNTKPSEANNERKSRLEIPDTYYHEGHWLSLVHTGNEDKFMLFVESCFLACTP